MSTNIFITGLQQLQKRLQEAADANRRAHMEKEARDVQLQVFASTPTSPINEPVRPIRSLLKGAGPTAQRNNEKRRVPVPVPVPVPAVGWRTLQSVFDTVYEGTNSHYLISGDGSAFTTTTSYPFLTLTADYLFTENPYGSLRPFTPVFNSAWTAWHHAGSSTWTRFRWCLAVDLTTDDFTAVRGASARQTIPGVSSSLYEIDYRDFVQINDWAHFRLTGEYDGSSGFGGGLGAPEIYLEMRVTGGAGEDPNELVGIAARNPLLQIVANNDCTIECIAHTTNSSANEHLVVHKVTKSAVINATPADLTALETVVQSVYGSVPPAVPITLGPFPNVGAFWQLYSYGVAAARGLLFEGNPFDYRLTGSAVTNPALAPTTRVVNVPPSMPAVTDQARLLNNTPAASYGISWLSEYTEGSDTFRNAGMEDADTRYATPAVFAILNNTHGFTEDDVYTNEVLSDFYTLMGAKPTGYALEMPTYYLTSGAEFYAKYWTDFSTFTVLRFADDPTNYRTSSDPYYYDYGDLDSADGKPALVASPATLSFDMTPLASRKLGPNSGVDRAVLLYATAFNDTAYVQSQLIALGITV